MDDSDYQVPFAFTGKLEKIPFDLGETSMTPEAAAKRGRARHR